MLGNVILKMNIKNYYWAQDKKESLSFSVKEGNFLEGAESVKKDGSP